MTQSTLPLAEGLFSMSEADLWPRALETFRFQYEGNPIYRQYTDALGIRPGMVRSLPEIPFLPVGLFKTHDIRTGGFTPEIVFESSGTTGTVTSRHAVKDLGLYRKSFMSGFERFYGPVKEWCIIGLLPAYLERPHSSLVLMVHELIAGSGHADSGFFLYEHEALVGRLERLEHSGQKTLLIGVSFALLDLAEKYSLSLKHTVVMETGGMKGRRREITREELHAFLKDRLGLQAVHAEYGMTELLSQAYSSGCGLFCCPPWMKVLTRNEDDPMVVRQLGEGLINIIDLANTWSCAFLATEDIGRVRGDGRFEVAGRVDHADIRGCSLLLL